MPWCESRAVDQRLRFISALLSEELTMTQACEAYGISRKTGYKWQARYAARGAAGLAERSHAPLKHGRATDGALSGAIIALKLSRPSWGPRKIVGRLKLDRPELAWPAASTAGEILKREGLVEPRHRRRRAPPTLGGLTLPERPNHVWAVDHKGWVRLGDGRRCEPLTITDGFSRYLLALSAGPNTREEEARPWFEAAFGEFGLPWTIRSDNGPPFASTGVTGLTALSVWWTKLGIRHERITPGKPQQNGRHERFHRTLLEAMIPPAEDQASQTRRFEAFRQDYNHYRPHEALGQQPPASLYRTSLRQLPERAPEPDYPAHAAVRRVRSNGEIKWRGGMVHVSSALTGEAVAVEETEHGQWQVRFHARPIGLIDHKTNRLRRLSDAATIASDLLPIHPG
jgi:transposase InsO family protein